MASDKGSWRPVVQNRAVGVKCAGRKETPVFSASGTGSESVFVGKAPTIDKMTKKKKKKKKKTRSKGLPQATPTAGKRLMLHEEIMTILSLKDVPRESDTAEDKKAVAEWLEFQEEIKREYIAKGYVEMDEEYFVERERTEALAKEAWDKIDFGRLVFLDSDDDSYVMKEGAPRWADGIVKE